MLQRKFETYRGANCLGSFATERDFLESTWLELPDLALIYVGDSQLNAFSALKRVKEITPEVKVVLYSEESYYALDAYNKGADYFLSLPADDIKIGKLVFRYLNI